jgi:hypothetical protein
MRVGVLRIVSSPLTSRRKCEGPSTSTATLPPGHVSNMSTMREPSPTGAAACTCGASPRQERAT